MLDCRAISEISERYWEHWWDELIQAVQELLNGLDLAEKQKEIETIRMNPKMWDAIYKLRELIADREKIVGKRGGVSDA